MAEVEGSRSFGITGDALWAVVADPARLADWVPTMRLAAPAGASEVHLEGESHGHAYSLGSMLRGDQGSPRLHWGADSGDGYRGRPPGTHQPPGSPGRVHVAVPGGRLGPH